MGKSIWKWALVAVLLGVLHVTRPSPEDFKREVAGKFREAMQTNASQGADPLGLQVLLARQVTHETVDLLIDVHHRDYWVASLFVIRPKPNILLDVLNALAKKPVEASEKEQTRTFVGILGTYVEL